MLELDDVYREELKETRSISMEYLKNSTYQLEEMFRGKEKADRDLLVNNFLCGVKVMFIGKDGNCNTGSEVLKTILEAIDKAEVLEDVHVLNEVLDVYPLSIDNDTFSMSSFLSLSKGIGYDYDQLNELSLLISM